MKLLFIVFLLPLSLNAQIYTKKDFKQILPSATCLFISGGFEGSAEYLKFHYDGSSQFWNPSLSWRNKWKNGDPAQGEKFFLSSTLLVGLTDGYHLLRTGRNVFIVTGIAIKIDEKKKWYKYLIDGLIVYTSYNMGFNLMYESLK